MSIYRIYHISLYGYHHHRFAAPYIIYMTDNNQYPSTPQTTRPLSIRRSRSKKRSNRTEKITRAVEKNGWKIIHIYGSAYHRGYMHGQILADEIHRARQTLPFLVREILHTNYKHYMEICRTRLKPPIQEYYPEIYQELEGIADGTKNPEITIDFLIAWNSFISMYEYFDTSLFDAPKGRCSAFIATGDSTADGRIVMAHNSHSDFVSGSFLNIILYVHPERGFPFCMQTCAGYVASVADWFLCGSGIIGCETTISDINYRVFDHTETQVPYFCRIRTAMQYGRSLDDYVAIMRRHNGGDYACSWLFGNIYTNEIMLYELGKTVENIRRTHNGVFYGMNSSISARLRSQETNDQEWLDITTSSGARNQRLHFLLVESSERAMDPRGYYGRIDIESAKKILADHYDVLNEREIMNHRSICNHTELSKEKNYYPHGCYDGKATNSMMAATLSFWGRWGSSCGRVFRVSEFIRKHPMYRKWKKYLRDFPAHKWVVLHA